MHEIVEVETVNGVFLWLAFIAPVVCTLLGAWIGARTGHRSRGAKRGLLIGLVGPANLLLWNLFNAITESNGLDSVRNVFINLVLFVCVGIVAGLALAKFAPFSERSGE